MASSPVSSLLGKLRRVCNGSAPKVRQRVPRPSRRARYSRGVIARYSRPAMAGVWSDEAKLARWLEVELAALEGFVETGEVPREAVEAIRAKAQPPTPQRVAEIEERTQHDVAAFVDAVAEQLGPDGRWLHYGLTSSDVLDTALALQVREAGELILEGIDRALAAVDARARRSTATRSASAARTASTPSRPPSGSSSRSGRSSSTAAAIRVARALEGMRVGKLSGAVGTYASADPEVERVACERLGPRARARLDADHPARPPRRAAGALAVVAASLEKFALEIRHLARTEVARGTGAVPPRPEGLVGDAAQAQPDLGRADLRPRARRPQPRARRARERGALARARHLALLGRARRDPGRLPRARLHARPLRLARSRG